MDLSLFNTFIKSLEWWKLIPSVLNGMKTIISVPANNDTSAAYIAAAAATEGSLLVAYIPPAHHGVITVDISVVKEPAKASWFDPTNGNNIPASTNKISGNSAQTFLPPGKNGRGEEDWILIIH